MTFVPSKIGQIVVPLAPRAIAGLDAQAIADVVAPVIIEAAAQAGGAPIGAPEILREDDLRSRDLTDELRNNIDRHPGRLWLVAEMIPIDEAADYARDRADNTEPALEIVAPPVHLPRGRRGRG